MRIAVVTGGKGFIGSHLAGVLAAEGWDVRIADLPEHDMRDQQSLESIFKGAHVVFHCAALPQVQYSIDHPKESNEVNVQGTLNVLLAARDTGVERVVYSASSSAYGDQARMPLREDMPARPKSPYGLQKYMGEHYARVFAEVYGLSTVSLRYFNVYGPGASAEGAYALVLAKFLKQRTEGKPMTITGDGRQTRDFIHVRDVVRANILAAISDKVGKGEVINIGAGENVSVNRIAELIDGPVEYVPARLEPHDTLADTALAKKLLGWRPTISIEEGIAELKALHNLVV